MDIILYNIAFALGCTLIGYIFGSIPTGVIIGKLFFKRDPRTEGSKNSGGTNVGRLFGQKAGLAVIILDTIKCIVPVVGIWAIVKYSPLKDVLASDTWNLLNQLYICLAGLGTILGHCWPLFAGFKGGKAVSVFCGFAIATCWLAVLVGVIVFFVSLKIKKYVSLSSMLTAVSGIITTWIMFFLPILFTDFSSNIFMWGNGTFLVAGWEYATTITLMAIILIIRHSANIKRLVNHEERKISWMK